MRQSLPGRVTNTKPLLLSLVVAISSFALITAFMELTLHHEFFRSDVADYWADSLNWQQPFNPFHVPGYPLVIAVLRGLSGGQFSAIPLMRMVNLGAYLGAILLVYALLREAKVSATLSGIGAALFGLWPFVGVVMAVNPRADLPAIALFLMGLLLLQKTRLLGAAFFWSLALITHKVMWLFVGFSVVATLFIRRPWTRRQQVAFWGILLLPLGTLWLWGTAHHDSVTWLLSANLQTEIAARGELPLLDGLVGTLLQGDVKNLLKGGLLTGLAILTLIVFLGIGQWGIAPYRQWGIAISAAILVLFVFLNQHEIWAALRFSRLLVLPMMWLVVQKADSAFLSRLTMKPVLVTMMVLLFITQIGYAWYAASVYFG